MEKTRCATNSDITQRANLSTTLRNRRIIKTKGAWRPFIPLEEEDHVSVPGCTLEAILGVGGMGTVYLARQDALNRQVAVKVLNSRLSEDPGFIKRLRDEAQIMGAMDHQNLVGCHDIIISKDNACLVMEYIPGNLNGRNLVELLGPMPEHHVVRVILAIARGLSYAYEKGYTHQDVKPENILFSFNAARPPKNYDELFQSPDRRIALCDFGIANAKSNQGKAANRAIVSDNVMGSPLYIAPEQVLMPDKVDCRTDIYALACTAHYFLTGEPPFKGDSWSEVLDQKVEHDLPIPHPAEGRLSTHFSHIFSRMGALNPDLRYKNYDKLLSDLEETWQLYVNRQQPLKTLIYGHKRLLFFLLMIIATIYMCCYGALAYYNHWLSKYEERVVSQTVTRAPWAGGIHTWRQEPSDDGEASLLIGKAGARPITLQVPLMVNDYIRLTLSCDAPGNLNLNLLSARDPNVIVGTITCSKVDGSYRLAMTIPANSKNSKPTVVAMPTTIPDANNQWLDLKIQFNSGSYQVWNRSLLLWVGHFDRRNAAQGIKFQVDSKCLNAILKRVIVIKKKQRRGKQNTSPRR